MMKKHTVLVVIMLGSIVVSMQGKNESFNGRHSPEFWQKKAFYDLSSEKLRTKFNQLVALMKRDDPNPDTHMGKAYKNAYYSTFVSDRKRNTITPTRIDLVEQILTKGDQGYMDLFLERKPIIEKFFDDLLSPETLTMIAYMQSRYGEDDPFRYNSALFAKDSDKYATEGYGKTNPTQVAITPTIFELDVTSYAFLNSFMNTLDTVTKNIANDVLQKRINETKEKELMDNILKITQRLDAALDEAIAQQRSQGLNFDSIVNNLRNLMHNGNPQIMQDLANIEKKYQK
jgi:hypothetical protein